MEKEQIIKALECCSSGNSVSACMSGCPLYEKDDCECINDDTAILKYALALIKSQDEQIFQLENRLKECENGYAGTLHIESCKLHDAEERVKELTEENERLKAEVSVKKKLLDKCVDLEDRVKADTVREIFKEIYSSLDYIEEQMEPEEIPECFFSVREDINALKEKFESEGAEK